MGWSFPGGTVVKNLPANTGDAGDTGLIPGSGRSSGGGNGNPLQYSCLENSMNRGAWWAKVHDVVKKSDMTERQHRLWLQCLSWMVVKDKAANLPLKCMWKLKGPTIVKTFRKRRIFNDLYYLISILTIKLQSSRQWYRSMKQNRKESKPSRWQSIDFWQRYQGIQWKRRESFHLMMLGQQDTHMQKKKTKSKKPRPWPHITHMKINPQWIIKFSVRAKPIKLLKKTRRIHPMVSYMVCKLSFNKLI